MRESYVNLLKLISSSDRFLLDKMHGNKFTALLHQIQVISIREILIIIFLSSENHLKPFAVDQFRVSGLVTTNSRKIISKY